MTVAVSSGMRLSSGIADPSRERDGLQLRRTSRKGLTAIAVKQQGWRECFREFSAPLRSATAAIAGANGQWSDFASVNRQEMGQGCVCNRLCLPVRRMFDNGRAEAECE